MARPTIVIVEYNAPVRRALSTFHDALGYRVLTATNWQEALELAEVIAFDVLFVGPSLALKDEGSLARTLDARGVSTSLITKTPASFESSF